MKKLTLFLSFIVITLAASAQTEGRQGENVIMTGFNIKDPVISAMIAADKAHRDSFGCGNLVIPRSVNKIAATTFPDNALKVCKILHDNGYEAYITGGCLRDLLLGFPANDPDVVTNATIGQQMAILGDLLKTHMIGTDTFGIVVFPDRNTVDLAQYSTCPPRFIDRGIVKNLKKTDKTLLSDSYERDLPFNAIYYDPYSGNLYDFHGGIQDTRDNTIHTSVDPDDTYRADVGSSLLRVLRFQARYNSTFAPELEEALLKNAPEYAKVCASNSTYSNIYKMFGRGYAEKCYRNLVKYRLFDCFMPCLSVLKNRKAYNAWIEKTVTDLDKRVAAGENITRPYTFAAITYPVYKQLSKKLGSAAATKKIMNLQDPVMLIWEADLIQKAYEAMSAK